MELEKKIAFILSEERHISFIQSIWDKTPEELRVLVINDYRKESFVSLIEGVKARGMQYLLASELVDKKVFSVTIDYGASHKTKFVLGSFVKKKDHINYKNVKLNEYGWPKFSFMKIILELNLYFLSKILKRLHIWPASLPKRYFYGRKIHNPFVYYEPLCKVLGKYRIRGDDSLDNFRIGWPFAPDIWVYDAFMCASPHQMEVVKKIKKDAFTVGYLRHNENIIKKDRGTNNILWYLTEDLKDTLANKDRVSELISEWNVYYKPHPDFLNHDRWNYEKKVIESLDKLGLKKYDSARHANLDFEFIFASKGGVIYSTIYRKQKLILLGKGSFGSQIFGQKINKFVPHVNIDSKPMSELLSDRKAWVLYERDLSELRNHMFADTRDMLDVKKFVEQILKKLDA